MLGSVASLVKNELEKLNYVEIPTTLVLNEAVAVLHGVFRTNDNVLKEFGELMTAVNKLPIKVIAIDPETNEKKTIYIKSYLYDDKKSKWMVLYDGEEDGFEEALEKLVKENEELAPESLKNVIEGLNDKAKFLFVSRVAKASFRRPEVADFYVNAAFFLQKLLIFHRAPKAADALNVLGSAPREVPSVFPVVSKDVIKDLVLNLCPLLKDEAGRQVVLAIVDKASSTLSVLADEVGSVTGSEFVNGLTLAYLDVVTEMAKNELCPKPFPGELDVPSYVT